MNEKQKGAVMMLSRDRETLSNAIARTIGDLLESLSNGNPDLAISVLTQIQSQISQDLLEGIIEDRENFLENLEGE